MRSEAQWLFLMASFLPAPPVLYLSAFWNQGSEGQAPAALTVASARNNREGGIAGRRLQMQGSVNRHEEEQQRKVQHGVMKKGGSAGTVRILKQAQAAQGQNRIQD